MSAREPLQGAALVTGAAQGIGAAVVRALAAQGWKVAALDRQPLAAWALEAPRGAAVLKIAADVSDAGAVEQAVARGERELGPIEALVNAAGVLRLGPALESRASSWDDCFAVNAQGVRNASCAVAERMVSRGRGAIVTVASNAARTPRVGMASYCASKAAAVAFTKVLGLELAPHGIRCNVVSPGSTDTPMQRVLWPDPARGAEATVRGDPARFRLGIPLGRIASPEDVADAVLYLLSPRARHITMQELCVDGGATL